MESHCDRIKLDKSKIAKANPRNELANTTITTKKELKFA